MALTITPNKQQALTLKQQLALLALPANKRIRLLKTLGRKQRQLARKRIQMQTDVNGQAFEKRKNGKKTKLLKRLGKGLEPYVINANRLELKHKNTFTGRIAAMQQEGGADTMTAGRMRSKYGTPDYSAPCSRMQAKSLAAEGYKVKRKSGKGLRKASLKEIQQRLTVGQAGAALKLLRNQDKKTRWSIPIPARPFLGDTPQNVQQQLMEIFNEMRK